MNAARAQRWDKRRFISLGACFSGLALPVTGLGDHLPRHSSGPQALTPVGGRPRIDRHPVRRLCHLACGAQPACAAQVSAQQGTRAGITEPRGLAALGARWPACWCSR